MEPAHSTPRSRFASTLGSMGTPARRAPGTPLSARRTLDRSLDRSTRGLNPFSYSTNNAVGTPKNIFRASMAGDRTRHNFTPRASSSLRQTYSPAPPSSARSFRATTAPSNGASAAKPRSADLFNQTIDDPPASLDGEALVNQVPDDPNRPGSIYADEFLAHTCPPGLDDLGRRQWFCILDLRRLKYAANELFAKKDWKINIGNFAKEYEKSRGLIMLRYGLYEFQTVKPTDEQVRKWRKDHDIPDPDEEDSPARRAQSGASKRKAEEEMPLTTSKSNKNKRRQTEPAEPLAKGKRRAASDIDQDENQPTKMAKPNTPSQSLSAFMKAAAGSNSQPTPSRPASSLFAGKASVGPARSVFDDPNAASAPSPNLFEYLSDASRAPSVANADASGESDDADSEADDTEGKDASEPSVGASAGIGTPADREGTPSLFDRVTKDKNGQPVRVVGGESEKPKTTSFAPPNQTWNTGTPIKFSGTSNHFGAKTGDEAADKPAPFKPMFGAKTEETKLTPPSAAPAPAAPSSSQPIFGSAPSKAPEAATKPEAKTDSAPASLNIFTSPSEPAESVEAPKPAASNIFGSAPSTQSSTAAPSSSLFGSGPQVNGTKPAATSSSTNGSVLGSSTMFGGKAAESTEAPKPALTFGSAPAAATSTFGAPASSSGEPSKPIFAAASTPEIPASKPLFGAAPENDKAKPLFGAAPDSDKAKPLFGASQEDDKAKPLFGAAPEGDKAKLLFGATSADNTKPLFAAAPAKAEDKKNAPAFGSAASSEPPVKKHFGGPTADDKPASSLFSAGAASNEKPKTSLFGVSSQPANIFGCSTTLSTPAFGTGAPASDTSADKSKPLFGFGDASKPATTAPPSAEARPLFSFGSNASQPTPTFGGEQKSETGPSSNLFGNSAQTQSSGNLFGGSSSTLFGSGQSGTSTPGSSFNFSASGPVHNPFASQNGGGASGTSINLNFGANAADSKPANAPFMFGGTGASAQPASSSGGMFSFGASAPATPPATSGAPTFSFTGATPTGSINNLFAPQPSGLAAPGGTSTGTSSPFNFGGASSLATTPAATTPEPTTAADEGSSKQPAAGNAAEEGEEKQNQINLTEGGPGEEDEEVVYDVRCKALKEELETPKDSEGKEEEKKKSKSAWSIKGVGPLRILKHKTTGAVRLILRAEPRGNVVINSVPIPGMPYTVNGKYVVAPFPSEKAGLEKWMLMVKTPDAANALAEAINKYKNVEKKDEKAE